MRLQESYIKEIVNATRETYGENANVYLFGSRLDDSKRGGDIDLLIRTPNGNGGILTKIRLAAKLKTRLGEQKIDIVGDHEDSVVAREALINGVLLS